MKRLLVILCVVAFFASACGEGGTESTDSTEGSGAVEDRVEITNFAFTPETVTVGVGATVVWENTSGTSHTATSENEVWDSGTIAGGDRFSFSFAEPGTFDYFCSIHSSMKGTVVVE